MLSRGHQGSAAGYKQQTVMATMLSRGHQGSAAGYKYSRTLEPEICYWRAIKNGQAISSRWLHEGGWSPVVLVVEQLYGVLMDWMRALGISDLRAGRAVVGGGRRAVSSDSRPVLAVGVLAAGAWGLGPGAGDPT
jgi:hypothetical protein